MRGALFLTVAAIALSTASSAEACRNPANAVQMLFEARPASPPEGTRVLHGRFTNQTRAYRDLLAARPTIDVEGDIDATLLAVIEADDGTVTGVYEIVMSSCSSLFGRDRMFDSRAFVVGRPVAEDAINPVGQTRAGQWREF